MRRALDPTRPLRVRWATAPLRRDAYMFEQDPEIEEGSDDRYRRPHAPALV